jgi:outer membrane protein OmpA-like peptidoglycan-associated protein
MIYSKRLFAGLVLASVVGFSPFALAQTPEPSPSPDPADAIRRMLDPPKTRSLVTRERPDSQASDESFIKSLRNKGEKPIAVADRAQLDTVLADKPAADLTMEFDYNSDVLKGAALDTAKALGRALSSPNLKDRTFIIAGYTDSKGSDRANQILSERRAMAVKNFLVNTEHLKPSNLLVIGYGKTHLKKPDAPTAAENRRVQAINVLPYASAGQ